MSKTFSNTSGNRDIRVIDSSERGFIIRAIDHAGARSVAVTFNNDTAPALALAILEAAGVEPVNHSVTGLGKPNWLEGIAHSLKLHIEHEAKATAEAEAQAKLEAEALEFLNVYRSISGGEPLKEWRQAGGVQEHCLAIARHARTRRAREMRAEK